MTTVDEANPFAEVEEDETMLLLDITGSNNDSAGEWDSTPRRVVVSRVIPKIVARLAEADSQSVTEDEEGGGGLRTVAFANEKAYDLGDLNTDNLETKWSQISWSGTTWIMPGMKMILQIFNKEFGNRKDDQGNPIAVPHLKLLVITDGEAKDSLEFEQVVARASGTMTIVLAIHGHGRDHDRAIEDYTRISRTNPHVKVVPLTGQTNPDKIADLVLEAVQ